MARTQPEPLAVLYEDLGGELLEGRDLAPQLERGNVCGRKTLREGNVGGGMEVERDRGRSTHVILCGVLNESPRGRSALIAAGHHRAYTGGPKLRNWMTTYPAFTIDHSRR